MSHKIIGLRLTRNMNTQQVPRKCFLRTRANFPCKICHQRLRHIVNLVWKEVLKNAVVRFMFLKVVLGLGIEIYALSMLVSTCLCKCRSRPPKPPRYKRIIFQSLRAKSLIYCSYQIIISDDHN